MSSIRSTVGLNSGIDIAGIVSQLIAVQRAPAVRLEERVGSFQGVQAGVQALEASVLGLSTSVATLGSTSTFEAVSTSNSDTSQLSVSAGTNAALGSFAFQSLRLARAEQRVSKGFANPDQQTLGTGTITLSQGGKLATSTRLDTFNGGAGVKRGSIRITDRSGASSTIDLSKAFSINDVLSAINDDNSISVTASTSGGKLILTDSTGSTATNLIVEEVGTGQTAADLGIRQSVASTTLTGSDVHYLTDDFTLDQLNDGNGTFQFEGVDDLRFTTTDGTEIDINLDDIFNLSELISAINDDSANGGKLTASLSNGSLVLTDSAGGGGSLSVSNLNSAAAVEALGLDNSAVGNVLTGDRLLAGIGSRLIRNLNGGQGITTPGSITVTDRSGLTATLDLSSAQSLDEVLVAINSAVDDSTSDALSLTAWYNSLGTGIEVVDSSGSTASNLIIADVGGGSVAVDLGLTVNAAQTSVDSGSLDLRRVGQSTLLSDFTADGNVIEAGSFLITDTAGNQETITISSSVTTIGGVLQRINNASTVQVTARLNDTGDGFLIEDTASGAGTLKIEEVTGSTASDLRILGEGVVGGGGNQEISGRDQTVITVDSDDTLDSLVTKINDANVGLGAGVVNDGSSFNAFRLSLTSEQSGSTGEFVVDSGGLNLGLSVTTQAQDALLQVGADVGSSFLLSSNTNQFKDVSTGVSVSLNEVGDSAAQVQITRDTSTVRDALSSLVSTYNTFISTTDELTKFDENPANRGVLQGQGIVLRVTSRLNSLFTKTYFGTNETLRGLGDLGVRVTSGGKLEFDQEVFDSVNASSPDAVKNFFLDANNGVADKLDTTLDSLTDTTDGLFTVENTSLQNSIDSLQSRIDAIDDLLVIRQERLLRQFIQMEKIIGEINSQSSTLTALLSTNKSS